MSDKRKTAVYMATREWYEKVMPSVKSMLKNSPGIDRIVILIEDDEFPYPLPEKVETRNVADQLFFPPNGPNRRATRWTYMVLMRAALAKLFPECDKILSVDADTLVYNDVTDLWNLDMYEKIVAGVPEPWKSQQYGMIYINAGVSFWNLEYMREIGADVMFIWQLNQKHYDFCEQDCLNELFTGFIYPLPGEFNVSAYTTMPEGPIRIRHFAAEKDWFEKPVVMEWRK